ncbi:hypothetical protein SDC9_54211 [bioreactor metagenome]|jgi:hypothetical protein|uniref:Uncharacterized protein n=2 Tax=root TaxID=1 RepID=A0A562JCF3_9FIRM|nr:hypothetical protein [Sedimentibacter saalensis]MEA5096863.1 hypothetical protein [Sedimentibacter saalensis]TWH80504.1 hypothetical protein LY60_01766 [Sedimentibacter saalensis]
MSQYSKDDKFIVEKYIEISEFEKLKQSKCDTCCSGFHSDDSYFMAAVVACIEGNVQFCPEEKTWNAWLGNKEINFKPGADAYIFLSIYDFVKNNKSFFSFITKYFDLWHSKRHSDYTYDEYHKRELKGNFHELTTLINNDLEQAFLHKDYEVASQYFEFKKYLSTGIEKNLIYS